MNDCAHTSGDCGTVVLDGTVLDVSGWFGRALLTFFGLSGAVAQCPNNNCTGLQLVSGPGGANVWQPLGGPVTFIPNPNWDPNDPNSSPGIGA
jgi:hypothetical protein